MEHTVCAHVLNCMDFGEDVHLTEKSDPYGPLFSSPENLLKIKLLVFKVSLHKFS